MRKLLLVDDEPDVVKFLKLRFESKGYAVVTAGNGPQALQVAESELPDVIILDILMPGMDGFEVCEHLKNKEKTADIPVVMLTCLTDEKSKTKSKEVGAAEFISKPFDFVKLEGVINDHFKKLEEETGKKK
ncbi:MAG: response regulator [Candidatus Margulisiibacteriota bacterium]